MYARLRASTSVDARRATDVDGRRRAWCEWALKLNVVVVFNDFDYNGQARIGSVNGRLVLMTRGAADVARSARSRDAAERSTSSLRGRRVRLTANVRSPVSQRPAADKYKDGDG